MHVAMVLELRLQTEVTDVFVVASEGAIEEGRLFENESGELP